MNPTSTESKFSMDGDQGNSFWPSSASNQSSDDDIAERSSSILWGTICTWCVMQGKGAKDEDVNKCAQLTRSAKNSQCIAKLCKENMDWTAGTFREEIALLIAHGAQINARHEGRNALHEAAKAGNANAVTALLTVPLEGLSSEDMLDLELEAHSSAYGYERSTEALDDATRKARNEVGMDITCKTAPLGLNCAHLAAMRNHTDVLKVLDKFDAKARGQPVNSLFDAEDQHGFTPAMYAAEKGHMRSLKILHSAVLARFGEDCRDGNMMHLTSFSNDYVKRSPPRLRSLSHYAAMNGRVNVLRYLHSIGCLYHSSQDCECLTPIDLAVKFKRLGAEAFLKATCRHPFLDNDFHCGICHTFVRLEGQGKPQMSPIPGHFNMTVCDSIIDQYLDERRRIEEYRLRRRRLAAQARRALAKKDGTNSNEANAVHRQAVVIRREVEIEDLETLAIRVVKELGIDGEWEQQEAQNEARDKVRKFREENDHIDAVDAPAFHTIIRELACVSMKLTEVHLKYVATPKAATLRLRSSLLNE